jgi:hypothetical protein
MKTHLFETARAHTASTSKQTSSENPFRVLDGFSQTAVNYLCVGDRVVKCTTQTVLPPVDLKTVPPEQRRRIKEMLAACAHLFKAHTTIDLAALDEDGLLQEKRILALADAKKLDPLINWTRAKAREQRFAILAQQDAPLRIEITNPTALQSATSEITVERDKQGNLTRAIRKLLSK